jgi:hypothetical protein
MHINVSKSHNLRVPSFDDVKSALNFSIKFTDVMLFTCPYNRERPLSSITSQTTASDPRDPDARRFEPLLKARHVIGAECPCKVTIGFISLFSAEAVTNNSFEIEYKFIEPSE